MDWSRPAMVFSHPGHEFLCAGMLQRFRPQILFLTRADNGRDREREATSRAGLARLGLEEHATFVGLEEAKSYRWAREGLHAPYVALRETVLAWLRRTQPTVVLGDALELTNFHHDVGRVVLDAALARYGLDREPPTNVDLPLFCRTDEGLRNLRYQQFPDGGHAEHRLTPEETACKRELATWLVGKIEEASWVTSHVPAADREPYRVAPAGRTHLAPPSGLQRHYEQWGRMQVVLGKYDQPLLFEEHFLPIVRAVAGDATEHNLSRTA